MMKNKVERRKEGYILAGLFLVSALLRFLIGNYYPRTVNCYPDELLYLSAAESLWNGHDIMVYNAISDFGKIGYSFLIAPAFAFSDMKIRMTIIAWINGILMSLGVFPVYGLANRILRTRGWKWLCVCLYLISPTLTYSMTFNSEVLFIPLALLLLYMIFIFIEEEMAVKKRAILLAGIFLVWIMAYMTKEIALIFPAAVIAYYMIGVLVDVCRRKTVNRMLVISLLLILAAAVGIYLASNGGSHYYQLNFDFSFLGERLGYLIYGTLFFFLASLIAFFVIPVVFPAVFCQALDQKTKKLFLFLVLLLAITAFVVSYTIYIYEDYPSLTPRAHIRYVEYLSVPFMIVCCRLLERCGMRWKRQNRHYTVFEAEGEISENIRMRWWHFLIIGMVCLAVIVGFPGFYGWTVDNTSLFYLQLFSEDGHIFAREKVLVFTVLLSLIIVGMLVLFYRKRKVFTALLLTALIGISLGNSVLSCYIQYRTHTHPREEAVEMEELRQFVLKHPESTFAVLPPFSGGEMVDTYLMDCRNVLTLDANMIWIQGYTGTDLKKHLLLAPTSMLKAIYDRTQIDYVIVYEAYYRVGEGSEEIRRFENSGFSLRKLENPWWFPLVIPQEVSE